MQKYCWTYAEALYEINGTISDSDLDKTVNLFRARLHKLMSVQILLLTMFLWRN